MGRYKIRQLYPHLLASRCRGRFAFLPKWSSTFLSQTSLLYLLFRIVVFHSTDFGHLDLILWSTNKHPGCFQKGMPRPIPSRMEGGSYFSIYFLFLGVAYKLSRILVLLNKLQSNKYNDIQEPKWCKVMNLFLLTLFSTSSTKPCTLYKNTNIGQHKVR